MVFGGEPLGGAQVVRDETAALTRDPQIWPHPPAKWEYGEKQPAMSQKEGLHPNVTMLGPWSWTSASRTREINICCLKAMQSMVLWSWSPDGLRQMFSPKVWPFSWLDHVHDALYLISRFLLTNCLPTRVGFQPEATAWIKSRGQTAFLFDRKLLMTPYHFLQLPILTMTYSTLMIAIMV